MQGAEQAISYKQSDHNDHRVKFLVDLVLVSCYNKNMTGTYSKDPNNLIPTGFVFKNENGPLMVVGFLVFNHILTVLVRNMETKSVSDLPYNQVGTLFEEYQKTSSSVWT